MSRFLSKMLERVRRFHDNEDGNGTLEFVLVLPPLMVLFFANFEGGILSTRHVMLERGLDATVREVRIGAIPVPTHDNLTARICRFAAIIPDCINQIRLEMVVRDPRNWIAPPAEIACVDREEEGEPTLTFNPGLNNELMILRVCALFDPILPTGSLGSAIPKESQGAYALVATASYVMEPFQ